MEQKYGEFVGVDSVYTADVLVDDEGNYTAGIPEYLAPVAEIAGEAEISNTTNYYDNKPGINYVTEGVTSLAITVSNVPAEKLADHLGKSYDATSGRVYDSGQPNPPDKAIGFRYNMGRSGYRYYWYLKGTFSGGAEEAASKSADVDIRTYQLTFTAMPTTHEWEIDGEQKPLKRVFGDTADPSFNPAAWFTQVQTPDTETPPAALTLANSVPADGAPAVAVGANIVLTFSNKIAGHAITMLDETFTPVPVAFSFDATGKILTINPNADLSAATTYGVIINGVKDIYGQVLATQTIDFTTA